MAVVGKSVPAASRGCRGVCGSWRWVSHSSPICWKAHGNGRSWRHQAKWNSRSAGACGVPPWGPLVAAEVPVPTPWQRMGRTGPEWRFVVPLAFACVKSTLRSRASEWRRRAVAAADLDREKGRFAAKSCLQARPPGAASRVAARPTTWPGRDRRAGKSRRNGAGAAQPTRVGRTAPVMAGRGLLAVALDLGQHGALGDRSAGFHGETGDGAVLVRGDRVLHLHGL